jgi:hypothetical protein
MSKEYADVGMPVLIAGFFVVLFVLGPEILAVFDGLLGRLNGVVAPPPPRGPHSHSFNVFLLARSGVGLRPVAGHAPEGRAERERDPTHGE